MPHSYACAYIHAVWSTKDRRPLIADELREPLWAYVIGTEKALGIRPIATGGVADHLHALFVLPATMAFATAIQKIKANSTRWMRERVPGFEWQQGYGAFTVSPSHVAGVTRYVHRQAEHHRRQTFEDEFIAMLVKAGIEYDPRYVFG